MPHDKNGTTLAAGDQVTLRCIIKSIDSASETQCNVTAEAAERPEGEDYIPSLAGNSRFYEKLPAVPPKEQIEWAQNLFNGAADALNLSVEFRLFTCWEELLGKIQEAARNSAPPAGVGQFAGDHVAESKFLRKTLDDALQQLRVAQSQGSPEKAPRTSRERSIALTKIQEAIMWLGMDLKAINESSPGAAPNPYPQSYNPASPVVEPTADGIKL